MGRGGEKQTKRVQKKKPRAGKPSKATAASSNHPASSGSPVVEILMDSQTSLLRFLQLKSGDQLDSWKVQANVQEVFRMKEGIFFVRNHTEKEECLKLLPCLGNLTFGEIAKLYEDNYLEFGDVKENPGVFFDILESLPINPHRTGEGMLLPYIKLDLDRDENLDRILKEGGVNLDDIPGGDVVTTAYFSFPGSILSSRIMPGEGHAVVSLVMAGEPQTWLVVAAGHLTKVQDSLLKELIELKLDENDPLFFGCKNETILEEECVVLAPSFYRRHGIPFSAITQDIGESLMFDENTVRCGMSNGVNLAKAKVITKKSLHEHTMSQGGPYVDSKMDPETSQGKTVNEAGKKNFTRQTSGKSSSTSTDTAAAASTSDSDPNPAPINNESTDKLAAEFRDLNFK